MENERLTEAALAFTRWIGSPQSIVVHTALFAASFLASLFGWVSFDRMLLVLTTIVSLEAIYLAIFIQMSLNNTRASLEGVEADIDEIQEDVGEIQEDVDEIQKDVDEIQGDVDELQEDVEDISEDVEEMSEDEKEDEARKQEQKKALAGIQEELRKLAGDLENVRRAKPENKEPPAKNRPRLQKTLAAAKKRLTRVRKASKGPTASQ